MSDEDTCDSLTDYELSEVEQPVRSPTKSFRRTLKHSDSSDSFSEIDLSSVQPIVDPRPNSIANSSSKRRRLVRCVEQGDTTGLKALLSEGVRPNFVNPVGLPPLILTVCHRNVECFRSLIACAHTDINQRDEIGSTALMVTCRLPARNEEDKKSNLEFVTTLLSHKGVDVNAQDMAGTTALLFAVAAKEQTLVELLLEHGADPNLTNVANNSALHMAVENNDQVVVELLIAHGADTTQKNSLARTPEECTNTPQIKSMLRVNLPPPPNVQFVPTTKTISKTGKCKPLLALVAFSVNTKTAALLSESSITSASSPASSKPSSFASASASTSASASVSASLPALPMPTRNSLPTASLPELHLSPRGRASSSHATKTPRTTITTKTSSRSLTSPSNTTTTTTTTSTTITTTTTTLVASCPPSPLSPKTSSNNNNLSSQLSLQLSSQSSSQSSSHSTSRASSPLLSSSPLSPRASSPLLSSSPLSPRGNSSSPLWLSRDMKVLKQQGCQVFVSCCEDIELKEMGLLQALPSELQTHGIEFRPFPIQKWIPRISLDEFVAFTRAIAINILEEEKVVLIHSDAGKGRAALVAAGVLVHMGYTQKEAIEILASVDNQTLQNPLFYGYLSLFCSRLKKIATTAVGTNGTSSPSSSLSSSTSIIPPTMSTSSPDKENSNNNIINNSSNNNNSNNSKEGNRISADISTSETTSTDNSASLLHNNNINSNNYNSNNHSINSFSPESTRVHKNSLGYVVKAPSHPVPEDYGITW